MSKLNLNLKSDSLEIGKIYQLKYEKRGRSLDAVFKVIEFNPDDFIGRGENDSISADYYRGSYIIKVIYTNSVNQWGNLGIQKLYCRPYGGIYTLEEIKEEKGLIV